MESNGYQAMADDTRRDVLQGLLEEEPIHISSTVSDAVSEAEHQRQLIQLYHYHLPMLADEGFVEWDQSAGTVTTGPDFDDVRPLVSFHVNESAESSRFKVPQNDDLK